MATIEVEQTVTLELSMEEARYLRDVIGACSNSTEGANLWADLDDALIGVGVQDRMFALDGEHVPKVRRVE